MKRIFTTTLAQLTVAVFAAAAALAFMCMFMNVAQADDGRTLTCKQYGYTADPEKFHEIDMEDLEEQFTIMPSKVITKIGRTYTWVPPESVGFDKGVATYMIGIEVLYLYMVGDKLEIGISQLIEDSDAGFADKAVFKDCALSPSPAMQQVTSFTRVSYTF